MIDILHEDRAQVGIGTLIVFIAMVLVAAIAAGVLVDTAGMLQSKSQQTGEDSTDAVTNRLEVVDTYGIVRTLEVDQLNGATDTEDATGDYYVEVANGETNTEDNAEITAVHELNFIVMKSAGAGNIQLEEVVLMWQGPDGATERTIATGEVNDVTGTSDNVLNEQSDRARVEITLDPGDTDNDGNKDGVLDALQSGEEVTVKFTTTSGATVRKTISVPSTLSTDDGSVVQL